MCGFVGMMRTDGNAADAIVIHRMNKVLWHRGPEAEGTFFSGPLGMGFRRLSILDLSPLGHQPMSTPDGIVTIVFNGEIYNYRELRQDLQARGHTFRSTGDTEVLLHAYREWGNQCLERLNGMWAFLIFDKRTGKLFGSRDRFGIKPLYYYRNPDFMLFGSEIKAIRASGLYGGGVNWPIAASFLLQGTLDLGRQTFFENIEQIPSGTAFELEPNGSFHEWRYWSVRDIPEVQTSNPAEAFADLFEDAMRLHMRSDVPIGVHLSGGMDSTSIICAAARIRDEAKEGQPLQAFSYQTREYDETAFIEDTINQTGAQLIKLEADPLRLWDSLSTVLWYQDEPFHSIQPLVSFELMRLSASHGFKVILNGQGSDETQAGYSSYFRDYWNTLLQKGQLLAACREIREYAREYGGNPLVLLAGQVRHLIQSQFHRLPLYRSYSNRLQAHRGRSHPWFSKKLAEKLLVENSEYFGMDINAALARSVMVEPLPLYLRIEDRNSMAHSIEVRVPFLDYRLVSFAFGLPADWRMRGPWNKFLLRQGMRNRIPESVRSRIQKFGFNVPIKKWFAGDLYEPVRDLLSSRRIRERGIYNLDVVVRDLERHRRGEVDVGFQLFRIIQFERWSEMLEQH